MQPRADAIARFAIILAFCYGMALLGFAWRFARAGLTARCFAFRSWRAFCSPALCGPRGAVWNIRFTVAKTGSNARDDMLDWSPLRIGHGAQKD